MQHVGWLAHTQEVRRAWERPQRQVKGGCRDPDKHPRHPFLFPRRDDEAKPVPPGALERTFQKQEQLPGVPQCLGFSVARWFPAPQPLFQWTSLAILFQRPPQDSATPLFACKAFGTVSQGLVDLLAAAAGTGSRRTGLPQSPRAQHRPGTSPLLV